VGPATATSTDAANQYRRDGLPVPCAKRRHGGSGPGDGVDFLEGTFPARFASVGHPIAYSVVADHSPLKIL